jgi:tRNA pseudouridine(38-40) synthase
MYCRFSATQRQYKYFLVQRPGAGALDVPAMRAAATHFLGEHDFRNFCKASLAPPLRHFCFFHKLLQVQCTSASALQPAA